MNEFEGRAYHFIGIGGAGMSVVADLLAARGAHVSGSDRTDSKILDSLRERGVDAFSPHGAKPFRDDAVVVLSSAIRADNPELEEARRRGQTVIHRSEALAAAARGRKFVAVAGSHGKTSTSSMIATALIEVGLDPSFAVGGAVLGYGGGGRHGSGPFIAEADESDGSFLNYRPTIAVVTGVEPDHLDHFGSREAFEAVFAEFARRIVRGGTLVCCAEDEGALRLADKAEEMPNISEVITYGRPERSSRPPNVAIENIVLSPNGSEAQIGVGDAHQDLVLNVPGEHNVLNATAAWVVCTTLGAPSSGAANALSHFKGAGRRFELKGTVADRRAYDDYAHHPTEVEAALKQARIAADGGAVTVVFQPHLFTRTQMLADKFADALALADHVVVSDIYPAREDPIEGVTSQLILDHKGEHDSFEFGGGAKESARLGALRTGPGDICVLMGAGDIFLETPGVLSIWEKDQ